MSPRTGGPSDAILASVSLDPSTQQPDDAAPDDLADTPEELSADAREAAGRPEHRYQMVLAALTAMALHLLLPHDFVLSPTWIYPVLMGGFLVLLIAGDPGLVDHERGWVRLVTNLMIVLIALSNLFAVVQLCDGILSDPQPEFANDPTQLLGIGAIVWATNVIAFALWYWDVDGGGSAKRAARGPWADPAFIWPEMHLEGYMSSGWYPQFADYLALSFNTATAFSPTDVSAVKRWAKMLMIVESGASLVIATLVISQAINSLGS